MKSLSSLDTIGNLLRQRGGGLVAKICLTKSSIDKG